VFGKWLTGSIISFITSTCIDLAFPVVGTLLRIIAIKTKFQ